MDHLGNLRAHRELRNCLSLMSIAGIVAGIVILFLEVLGPQSERQAFRNVSVYTKKWILRDDVPVSLMIIMTSAIILRISLVVLEFCMITVILYYVGVRFGFLQDAAIIQFLRNLGRQN